MVLSAFFRVLAFVLIITFLVWFGGRLLGIRQSWAPGLVASVVGLIIGSMLAVAVDPQALLPYPIFFFFAILLPALLASMGVSVLQELLARPGPLVRVQGRLVTVPHPLRSLRGWTIRRRRCLHITRIVARHGLVSFLRGGGRTAPDARQLSRDPELAHHLRDALEEASGVFVKLGQLLSTRSDLLPAPVLASLATLQDTVAPAPRAAVDALLAHELGSAPMHPLGALLRLPAHGRGAHAGRPVDA